MGRVIIPAAGRGSRLRPLTDDRPKGLVELHHKPLLQHSVEKLDRTGLVSELVIVIGYRGEMIREAVARWRPSFPVRFVTNADFSTTNSIYSLGLTRDLWSEGFALIDSDLHYDERLLPALLTAPGDHLLVDATREHARVDMKVTIRDGLIWNLDKALGPSDSQGEFFGMSCFTPRGAQLLREEIDAHLHRGETGVWYEHAIREVARRRPITPIFVDAGTWCEIDSEADLRAAEKAGP